MPGQLKWWCGIVQLRLDAAATAAIEAFHVCPSLDILVPTLIQHGPDLLHEHIALTPGKDTDPFCQSNLDAKSAYVAQTCSPDVLHR